MTIDGAQVDAIARHVHDNYGRRRRLDSDERLARAAVAEALARAMAESLTDLSGRVEPDEVLVDLAHGERHTIGPRGLRLTLTVLAATNRRLWHLVHRDGAVVASVPMAMESVAVEKKSLAPSIDVERSGTGWRVTGGKSVVAWVQDLVSRRPQAPAQWLAELTPAPSAHPASWLPDPTGRHELRYWDGERWTEHVSDRGSPGRDPLG